MNQFDQVAQQLSLTMGGYEMIRADRSILIGCARDTIFSNSFIVNNFLAKGLESHGRYIFACRGD